MLRKENLEKEWEGGKKEGKKGIINYINDDAGNCVNWSEAKTGSKDRTELVFHCCFDFVTVGWVGLKGDEGRHLF